MNQIDFASMLTGDALLAKVRELPQIVERMERMDAWLDGQVPVLRGVVRSLVDQGYPFDDIQDFVEEFGAEALIAGHYETWCELSDGPYLNEAVAEFVEEFGIDSIDSFEQAHMGKHDSEAEFAEYYFTNVIGTTIPAGLVVNWQGTWDETLVNSYTYTKSGYVFHTWSVE